MTTARVFTQLLRSVESILGPAGFARTKRSFWIQSGNNIGIIDVQKSRKSTADRVLFTLNLGVWSDRVGSFVAGGTKSHPPEVDDCHWRERIGFLLPDREDKWWTINESDDAAAVIDDVGPVMESVAVPAVIAHINDDALRDEWLMDKSPGLTNVQRLMYLSILLKEIGPQDALSGVVADLKRNSQGKLTEAIVTRHVQKLELHA
ncbi:MAG: DUF4304 domain-containing protein [Gemmatimonadota bacterium]|nr:DUF4304 domain-containing protein [Gemmatimonadota bacterium]